MVAVNRVNFRLIALFVEVAIQERIGVCFICTELNFFVWDHGRLVLFIHQLLPVHASEEVVPFDR